MLLEVVIPAARDASVNWLIWSLTKSSRPPDMVTVVSNEVTTPWQTSVPGRVLRFESQVYPYGRNDVVLRRNIGIWHSAADAIVFLDDDELAPEGMLRAFETLLEKQPVVWGHHRFIDFATNNPLLLLNEKPGAGLSREHGTEREHSFQSGYAGCMGALRERFLAVGGFDLLFLGRHGNEDQNLARRISGNRIYVHEPPFAWHPTVRTEWAAKPKTNQCDDHQEVRERIGGVYFIRCQVCPHWRFDDGHEALFRDNVVIPFDPRLVSVTEEPFLQGDA